MDNNILFHGYNPIDSFFELSDKELMEKIEKTAPLLNYSNIKLIREQYMAIGIAPSLEELHICEAILGERRRYTEGLVFSEIDSDCIAIKETFDDLLKKHSTLKAAKGSIPLSMENAAHVLGEYLRMIGRQDSLTPMSSAPLYGDSEPSLRIMDNEGTPCFVFENSKAKETKKTKSNTQTAVIYLAPSDDRPDCEGSVQKLFEDEIFKRSINDKVKIGKYGIIGALSDLTRGVRLDISKLPYGDTSYSKAIVTSGNYLIFAPKTNVSELRALAQTHGLTFVYFANTTDTGKFEGVSSTPFNMPISLVKLLKNSQRCVIPKMNGAKLGVSSEAACAFAAAGVEKEELSVGLTIENNGRSISAATLYPSENAFGESVNMLTELILTLVARGINRRAICSVLDHKIPKINNAAESSKALGMILGVYRVGVEMALPVRLTNVEFKNDENRLLTAMYAPTPRKSVSPNFTTEGANVGFIPLATLSDGLVDFTDLRRICDSFTELCRNGTVLSARAVTGNFAKCVDGMENDLLAELNESGKQLAGAEHRICGILFETQKSNRINIVGKVYKASSANMIEN